MKRETSPARVVLIVAILLIAVVRVRVADAPLERDEGEYAYAGQLILQGVPPYQLAYNMKFPGTYYAYALILAIFGGTPWAIRIGLLFVNAGTTLLVFALARRLAGDLVAVIAAVTFALLSTDLWILGAFAHATHFALLPALAGLLLLLRAPLPRARLLASGALLGLAILMKQHALFFGALAAMLLLWQARAEGTRKAREVGLQLGALALGAALPFVAMCALFYAQGVLGKFWFWTFRYAREYVSQVPLSEAPGSLVYALRDVTTRTLPLWILAAVGLVLLWTTRWETRTRVFVTGVLLASLASVAPGFYFRQHYFILVLPALGLLAGIAVVSCARGLERFVTPAVARTLAVAVFALCVADYVRQERAYLFSLSPQEVSLSRYGSNVFIEAQEIAGYIRERTGEQDRIVVFGSEPEIYFYADRASATGYIYMYPLMEPQRYAAAMQAEMIREIDAASPRYLVFVKVDTSWLVEPKSNVGILTWAKRYARQCYDLVGVAEISGTQPTRSVWDAEVAGFTPQSQNVVYTFRKSSDSPCSVAP